MSKQSFNLAIIGAGASGLCAAISAARIFEQSGFSSGGIVLIESQPRIGKKILATGNGRCNITNKNIYSDCYYENGSFAMKIINRADNMATIDFFSSIGLLIREDGAGRIYPKSNQASSVLDALRFAVQKYNIQVITDTKIDNISKHKDDFLINSHIFAKRVVLATGGKSSKKLGSDGSGFSILKSFGVKVLPPSPALTGLLLENAYPRSLKGLRAECSVQICEKKSNAKSSVSFPHKMKILGEDRGEVQFNQNGVSGIPVMQVSRFASLNNGEDVFLVLDFLPDMSREEIADYINRRQKDFPFLSAADLLGGIMPKMLGMACVKKAIISPSLLLSKLRLSDIDRLTKTIKQEIFKIKGTQGFDFSQVTAGGADTTEFDENSLELRKVKGLYCCGELINVDGMCGGYNLQWAWSSGMISGISAAKSLLE